MSAFLHPAFVPYGSTSAAKPVWCVDADSWPTARARLPPAALAFAEASGFEPRASSFLLLPGESGIAGALLACDPSSARARDPFLPGKLATLLPAGIWRFAFLSGWIWRMDELV